MRNLIAAIATLCLSGPVVAASSTNYFSEAALTGGAGKVDASGDLETDYTMVDLEATLYFKTISAYDLPYSEAAFLNRPSFVGFSSATNMADGVDNKSISSVVGRYVLSSGYYGEVDATFHSGGSDTADENDDSDRNTYEFRVGKFLDESSSAFLGYVLDNNPDVNTLTFGMHFASPYSGDGAWIAYDFGGEYLVEDGNNEFAVSIGIAYYLSSRTGLGIDYRYADGFLADSNETTAYAEFYFTPKLSTRVNFSSNSFATVNEKEASLTLKFRY